jgi:hypothetical protein
MPSVYIFILNKLEFDRLVVVDCRVAGPVGSCNYYALGPVVVKVVGGEMRVVHVSGRHRQPRNQSTKITCQRGGWL